MGSLSRPVQLLLAVALIAIAYMALTGDSEPAKKSKPRPTRVTSNQMVAEGITQADLDASYEPLNQSPRDVFKPLVKRTRGGGSMMAASPDAVPSAFAGGEAGWSFTGIVDTNGLTQALLENRGSDASVFLSVGQVWKNLQVEGIGSSTLSVRGPDGSIKLLRLSETTSASGGFASGNEPLLPAVNNTIQNRFTITPENESSARSRAEVLNETK